MNPHDIWDFDNPRYINGIKFYPRLNPDEWHNTWYLYLFEEGSGRLTVILNDNENIESVEYHDGTVNKTGHRDIFGNKYEGPGRGTGIFTKVYKKMRIAFPKPIIIWGHCYECSKIIHRHLIKKGLFDIIANDYHTPCPNFNCLVCHPEEGRVNGLRRKVEPI